ncbi:MAG: ABC transporter ATP-binding protein [Solirubrobacteraceae bacterium]
MKELLSLNKYIFKYKYRLILGFIFIFLSNLFTVIAAKYVGKAINFISIAITNYKNSAVNFEEYKSQLINYGLIIVGLPLISGFFRYLMRQTIIVTSRLIEFDLRNDIYSQYQKLSISFYKKNKVGDLMNRITEDILNVRMYLGPGIMYVVDLVVLFGITFFQMLSESKNLTLFALIPLPFLSILIFAVSGRINKRSKKVQEVQSEISSYVQDIFSGIRIIKSFSNEAIIKEEYINKSEKYKEKSMHLVKTEAVFFPLMILTVGLSHTLILFMGGYFYFNGTINNIGTIAQFFLYINMLIWPFTALGWVSSIVQRASASQKRINEFLLEEPEIKNLNLENSVIEGKIEFKNVSFTYENTGIQALKNVSFVIEKGKTLAILGKTGSGKTTILELIARLYDIDEGEILIDDKPIKEINLSDLRNSIGFVPQENFLFSDSIQNNISFGKFNSTKEEVIGIAKKASIDDNIVRFKDQYDTLIGERGVTLSGGQKQRISIARAMIKESEILIFDDSLSALDTETEEKILSELISFTKNKTTIIVTHRISSAKNTDFILVLENGKVIETGNHDILINKKSYYLDIYNKQLSEKKIHN